MVDIGRGCAIRRRSPESSMVTDRSYRTLIVPYPDVVHQLRHE
ncbi:MAG: hypothetical protein Q4C47_10040 [Planctomycetia bacterium]|nr:hypothetical protein [Planctomycetia bacterium]